jgi:hypothetical protein
LEGGPKGWMVGGLEGWRSDPKGWRVGEGWRVGGGPALVLGIEGFKAKKVGGLDKGWRVGGVGFGTGKVGGLEGWRLGPRVGGLEGWRAAACELPVAGCGLRVADSGCGFVPLPLSGTPQDLGVNYLRQPSLPGLNQNPVPETLAPSRVTNPAVYPASGFRAGYAAGFAPGHASAPCLGAPVRGRAPSPTVHPPLGLGLGAWLGSGPACTQPLGLGPGARQGPRPGAPAYPAWGTPAYPAWGAPVFLA